MASVNIQTAINEYHSEMAQMGMNMAEFHSNWHQHNRDPRKPDSPDPMWGMDLTFGNDFLQMHHEMVKAKNNEPKFFMHHQSIVSWFESKQYDLPQEWNSLTPIPPELAFHPADPSLQRITDNPKFGLPGYFTQAGINAGEKPEPITRSEKLADFKNINQLGCCIIYAHNEWHSKIGGAMKFFNTAIQDPIFYFGVHWHIDKVFDEYKIMQSRLIAVKKSVKRKIPKAFTEDELNMLKTAEERGIRIRK